MAISDSYDHSITTNEIIQDGLEFIGVLGEGIPMTPEQLTKGKRALNNLMQQWGSDADFTPGRKMWARKRSYLFLADGQVEYDLGPSGDHCANSYIQTATSGAEATSATVIGVNDITGISAGDNFGIILDDGTLHWDVVTGAPAAGDVTITTGLPSAAAAGAIVFTYTSKIQRPQRILTLVRRNSDGDDEPMREIVDLQDYEAIVDKNNEGTPLEYHVEVEVDNLKILLDQAPDDLSYVIRITYHRPLADFDAANDTPDLPKIWYRPLGMQVGIDLAPKFQKPVSQDLRTNRDEALAIAGHEYAPDTVAYFEPDRLDLG